jgi:hypothetical protein
MARSSIPLLDKICDVSASFVGNKDFRVDDAGVLEVVLLEKAKNTGPCPNFLAPRKCHLT